MHILLEISCSPFLYLGNPLRQHIYFIPFIGKWSVQLTVYFIDDRREVDTIPEALVEAFGEKRGAMGEEFQ